MNIFQIKTKPEGIDRTREMIGDGKTGRVELGWAETGDLLDASKDDIRDKLATAPFNYTGQSLNTNLGTVNCFVNTIVVGDLGLIVEGDKVHGGILGPYEFKDGYHTRSIEWKFIIYKDDLNQHVRSFVENRTSCTKFKFPFEVSELEQYLNQSPIPFPNKTLQVTVNVDELVQKSLEILSDELQSGDRDRQVSAAVEILRFLRK
ncbi:hypothetical protein B1748_33135 [Paenibacillus sp. MY03]|uniref:hypothetical protein n=1 Tax=Paenibacillus sp. MY03 TaxID=302980 RepID=UPI000B3BE923|nr:hypothetical protein [Paenibacillus sp. MY03]OUS68700.1 hypothetical protein B1748_33135 [Paenibacillus sp. MY03]